MFIRYFIKNFLMTECSFCKIIGRESPAHIVFEDDDVLAFAPLEKVISSRGHILVIPKKHFADIYDIPQFELHKLMDRVKIIAEKLKKRFDATGINILHASGRSAQQSCFHFHMHLLPRYENDGLDTWPSTGYKEKEFPQVYGKIAKIMKD